MEQILQNYDKNAYLELYKTKTPNPMKSSIFLGKIYTYAQISQDLQYPDSTLHAKTHYGYKDWGPIPSFDDSVGGLNHFQTDQTLHNDVLPPTTRF